LKEVLANKIPYEQERIKKFRKEQGNVKIGEITVDMVVYSKFKLICYQLISLWLNRCMVVCAA